MDKPTLPQGTRDFGPATMAKRQFILNHIRSVFQLFGFQPLETPAMENLSTLTGKYGEEGDQLLFKILNSGDYLNKEKNGAFLVQDNLLQDRDSKKLTLKIAEKGLRYDLTVPFARYVVMNRPEITFPFKRYQIQPVWRADRPQRGRYREFYQCDADVVGTNSLICEVEIILMIREVFRRLSITDYSIKINHRAILSGIAEAVGALDKQTALFVAIDKRDKVGDEKVKEELETAGFTPESIAELFTMLSIKGSTLNKLTFLTSRFSGKSQGHRGILDLQEILNLLESFGVNDEHLEFDVSLARGLSYYTGCIFEVKVHNTGLGSVSGGGRYDNLTASFGDKDNLSGVGFSFGVDRLYDALEALQLFPKEAQQSSKVLICHFDEASQLYGLKLLNQLRANGIAAEVYPDHAKIKKQLDYANRKMIAYTIVIGSEEMESGLLSIKDMNSGEQKKMSLDDIVKALQ